MKWRVRLITKRQRKQPFRLKANSIEELCEKLLKHSGKIRDFEIETAVNDPNYWKSVILNRLFRKVRESESEPVLF